MRKIVLLDKAQGVTSNQAVQEIRRRFRAYKAGHTGTLDGFATGLLVIALGEARKAMPLLSGLDKEYTGTIKLHRQAKEGSIRVAAKGFVGTITQVPPKKSAVRRKPREREVYSFELTGFREREVDFRIRCQAGVYIRKLAHDFGKALRTGAHLASLRRVAVGPFLVKEASQNGEDIDFEKALDRVGVKKVFVKKSTGASVLNGKPFRASEGRGSGLVKQGGHVLVYCGSKLLAIGKKQGPSIRVDRVFNSQNQ